MRILLGAFMLFAGVSHLTFNREEFLAQVPTWLPHDSSFPDLVVLASGIVEIALGVAMVFWVSRQVQVGLALSVFFVLIFPGNISQYVNGIDAFGLDTDTKRLVRLFFQPVLIYWALWSTGGLRYLRMKFGLGAGVIDNFYRQKALTLQHQEVSMETYRGKVVVVVNTASKCGLTPQYEGLEDLYEKYKDQGLVVLGFPCNQFGHQEPGSAGEIEEFCQVNYGVSFPMFAKVDVNGAQAHPLFRYLRMHLGGVLGSRIKWNFTKFVVDRQGNPVKRFSPITKPEAMESYLQELFKQ